MKFVSMLKSTSIPFRNYCSETSKEKHNKEKQVSKTTLGEGEGFVKCLYNTGQAQHTKTQSILVDMV